jgi:hypothetical protein
MSMGLPYPTIYARIKKLLADVVNVKPERIKAKMPLADAPFRFDGRGLRALSRALNNAFKKPPMKRQVTPEQTGKARTVQSLADLVREAYK